MGGSNVAAAYAHWRSRLTHRELHVLNFMALTALDADRPPVYWGGWEDLAAKALGLDLEGKPSSAKRTTFQVLEALRAAGAITSSGQAHAGVRAVYALNLLPGRIYMPSGRGRDITWTAVERGSATLTQPRDKGGAGRSPIGEQDTHPSVSTTLTQKGEQEVHERGSATHTPRNHDEPPLGTWEEPEEEPAIASQPHPSTRVREKAAGSAAAPVADEPPSQQDRVNAAGAALRAQFPEWYGDDLAPTA